MRCPIREISWLVSASSAMTCVVVCTNQSKHHEFSKTNVAQRAPLRRLPNWLCRALPHSAAQRKGVLRLASTPLIGGLVLGGLTVVEKSLAIWRSLAATRKFGSEIGAVTAKLLMEYYRFLVRAKASGALREGAPQLAGEPSHPPTRKRSSPAAGNHSLLAGSDPLVPQGLQLAPHRLLLGQHSPRESTAAVPLYRRLFDIPPIIQGGEVAQQGPRRCRHISSPGPKGEKCS